MKLKVNSKRERKRKTRFKGDLIKINQQKDPKKINLLIETIKINLQTEIQKRVNQI